MGRRRLEQVPDSTQAIGVSFATGSYVIVDAIVGTVKRRLEKYQAVKIRGLGESD
jgi:hypothetical protein